ncbi:MAG: DMT family transporter [Thermoplasmata archaeon]|nr:DMT family transporter [Thermoplasmata archaeon]
MPGPDPTLGGYDPFTMASLRDVGFGLATAFGYGSSDYVAKRTTDRVGFVETLWYLELIGVPLLVVLALLLEGVASLPAEPLVLLAGLAGFNVVASFFLYRAFEFGTLAVVSPIASAYPTLIVVFAVAFLHERPTIEDAIGIALTLLGVVLITRVTKAEGSRAKNRRIGIVSAIIAFFGYGVFYFGLKLAVGPIPPLTSAAIVRVLGLLPVAVVAAYQGVLRLPRSGLASRALTIAILDSLALVAYNLGIVSGHSLAVLGTVSGLFSAVTVAWAVVLLKERLGMLQWVGAAAIFTGIVTLAVGAA